MKPSHHLSLLFFSCYMSVLFASLNSCSLDQKIENIDLAKPVRKVKPITDSIAYGVGKNLASGLEDNSQAVIKKALTGLKGFSDTLNPDIKKLVHAINIASDSANFNVTKVGDNLHWQIGRLRGDVRSFDNVIAKIITTLDLRTRYLLSNIIQTGLDTLKAPSTSVKIDSFVAHVLSEKTTQRTQNLVSGALQPTIDKLINRIDKIVDNDVPYIKKQAYWFLGAVTLAALIVIFFFWYQRKKYSRLAKIITYQIDKIKNQAEYDELTSRISSQAKREELEPLLKKMLSAQGIN
jgi:hypothetical protein